jgi:hypothetical protein
MARKEVAVVVFMSVEDDDTDDDGYAAEKLVKSVLPTGEFTTSLRRGVELSGRVHGVMELGAAARNRQIDMRPSAEAYRR